MLFLQRFFFLTPPLVQENPGSVTVQRSARLVVISYSSSGFSDTPGSVKDILYCLLKVVDLTTWGFLED